MVTYILYVGTYLIHRLWVANQYQYTQWRWTSGCNGCICIHNFSAPPQICPYLRVCSHNFLHLGQKYPEIPRVAPFCTHTFWARSAPLLIPITDIPIVIGVWDVINTYKLYKICDGVFARQVWKTLNINNVNKIT